MRVVWFTNVVLEDFASRMGLKSSTSGGWMSALLSAVRDVAGADIELTVVCEGHRASEATIGGVRYVALGGKLPSEAEKLIEDISPDVIHVHGSEAIAQSLPVSILRDRRTLLSIQGIINGLAPYYAGALSPSDLSHDRNLAKELLRRTGTFQLQRKWIEERSEKEKAVFESVANLAGRTDWDRSWSRHLNPNARYFEVGELLRAPFDAARRDVGRVVKHTIYCSASMAYPLKGGHWLLRAVAGLTGKYPDIMLKVAAARCVEVPNGVMGRLRWSDYHRYLHRLIAELGLAGHVALLDSLSSNEVYDELCSAEVFCLPSLCENSSNSLCEAMICGVPCVATYSGGTPSLLKNGIEGLLVPAADPASLAMAIDELFSNPKKAQDMADRARGVAMDRHDKQNVVGQLLKAYRTIVNDVRSRQSGDSDAQRQARDLGGGVSGEQSLSRNRKEVAQW